MKSALSTLARGYYYLLDILFPEHCLGCKKKGQVLCAYCVLDLRPAEREMRHGIVAGFDYRDPVVKRAIWDLKYHKRSHIGQILGELLYETCIEEVADMRIYSSGQPILVVPVPLSRKRLKERGYNQAEKIARGFCQSDEEGVFEIRKDLVIKKKDTTAQARIANRTKRLANIRGAFTVNETADIKNRTIIVIDDVTTTGGTLFEIMSLLKTSGARKVYGFAVAH